MNLRFGLSRAVPEGTTTAWGARLIAPADFVWDRQDLVAESDEAKHALVTWLNGDDGNAPAIQAMIAKLRELRLPQAWDLHTVHEDERGIFMASTNQSHGYVYVAGWLK